MKTLKTLLAAILLACTFGVAKAQPMSYYDMRDNARYLTDRMAYTLSLPVRLLDDLYRINYDYICGVNDYLDDVAMGYRYDDYMEIVYARDLALQRLLSASQWRRLMAYDYFYRPISFGNNRWRFTIYTYDPYRTRFYYRAPSIFADYRGGHFFGGMRPPVGGAHHGYDRPAPAGNPGYHFERPGAQPQPGGGIAPGGQPNMNTGRGSNRGTFNNNRPTEQNNRGGEMNNRSTDVNINRDQPNDTRRGNSDFNNGRGTYDTQRSSTRPGMTQASDRTATRTASPTQTRTSVATQSRTSAASTRQTSSQRVQSATPRSTSSSSSRSSASSSRTGAGRR